MEKIIEDAIKAAVAIIIGLFVIIGFKEFLAGIILIAVGSIIIGINENLRNLFWSFIKFLWDKVKSKETQKIGDFSDGTQQIVKSGGDSFVAGGDITIINQLPPPEATGREMREKVKRESIATTSLRHMLNITKIIHNEKIVQEKLFEKFNKELRNAKIYLNRKLSDLYLVDMLIENWKHNIDLIVEIKQSVNVDNLFDLANIAKSMTSYYETNYKRNAKFMLVLAYPDEIDGKKIQEIENKWKKLCPDFLFESVKI